MKKIFSIIFAFALPCVLLAQGNAMDYRRNSLGQMMVYHSEDEFGYDIFTAWDSLPFPDKFDYHPVGMSVIWADSITGVRKQGKAGLHKAVYGNVVLSHNEVAANAQALENVLNDNRVGQRMVALWFGLEGDSLENATFNTSLIQERGLYEASDVDVERALRTARGLSMLADAGEELINHTFLLVNDMTYVTAEQRAAAAKVAMGVLGGVLDALVGGNSGRQLANTAGAIADSFTGFTVITNSYLYQLEWNDSIADIFYSRYYTSTPNPEKVAAFLADSTTFRVRFVAHEHEYAGETKLKGKYTRSELVKMSCTRSIDKNIAALQLAYEDFKVKTPVYQVLTNEKGKIVGYAAKIGLKEGVDVKKKYQVVQRVQDPQTGRTKYRYVATLVPQKGKVWDNRYNAALEQEAGSDLPYTTFVKKSGGEILPGMLIVEGRFNKAVLETEDAK